MKRQRCPFFPILHKKQADKKDLAQLHQIFSLFRNAPLVNPAPELGCLQQFPVFLLFFTFRSLGLVSFKKMPFPKQGIVPAGSEHGFHALFHHPLFG